ncbi:MAG: SemiSWEET family transporter [Fibrobacterales bacterium]
MNQKYVTAIGWTASLMAITMYFSHIDQILLNLDGHKGSILLPAVTTLNAFFWTLYGTFKEKKDWPIIVCNCPGILLGIASTATSL